MKRINRISKLIIASTIGLGGIALFSACTPDNTERITTEPGVVDAPSTVDQLTVAVENQQLQVNDVAVTQPSIEADNGVIYPIDQVLLPPEFIERWNLG